MIKQPVSELEKLGMTIIFEEQRRGRYKWICKTSLCNIDNMDFEVYGRGHSKYEALCNFCKELTRYETVFIKGKQVRLGKVVPNWYHWFTV